MSVPPGDPLRSSGFELRALVWLLAGLTAAFAFILWPFLGAVLWAMAIAIVFQPVHEQVLAHTGQHRSLASLLTLALILLIVIIPLIVVGLAVVEQAAAVVTQVRAGNIDFASHLQRLVDALPEWIRPWLDRFGLLSLAGLQRQISTVLAGSGQFITSHLLGLGQNTMDFVVALFVMLYVLFFLLRDGPALSRQIASASPLRADHTARLLEQFERIVRATVKGNIVIALVQGTLGGIAFAVLGMPGALLWGTLMALLSLLPAVGAALVWGPVAVYLLVTGQVWQAIGLTLWGVLVIGLIDNLLRPMLVGKDTDMPDYIVLLATLGGIAVFGINGFVIGPVIVGMFLVAWSLFARSRSGT